MLPPESTATTGGSTVDRAGQQRRHADRAGRLDHQLAALQQHQQGPGDVLVGDRDHLVDELADVGEGEVAGPADRDAVGDRGVRLPAAPAGRPRSEGGNAAAPAGLHADDPDVRPQRLGRHRDARRSARRRRPR